MGRVGSAIYFLIVAKIGWQADQASLYMAPVFLLGVWVAYMAPETKAQDLPE